MLSLLGRNLNELITNEFVHQLGPDFILNRNGGWENAILVPLLAIGLGLTLGRLREQHNWLITLWLVLLAVPGAVFFGFPAFRIVSPAFPAMDLLMAIALWGCYKVMAASLPRSWRPGLVTVLLGFLTVVTLFNTYIYFRELSTPDDRVHLREFTDLLAASVAPGRMVLLTGEPHIQEFIDSNQDNAEFAVRGAVGIGHERDVYRVVTYEELFGTLLTLRGQYSDLRVIAEGPKGSVGIKQQLILDALPRCFPGTAIDRLRYEVIYAIPSSALSDPQCTSAPDAAVSGARVQEADFPTGGHSGALIIS
jgi:hypothetical protein